MARLGAPRGCAERRATSVASDCPRGVDRLRPCHQLRPLDEWNALPGEEAGRVERVDGHSQILRAPQPVESGQLRIGDAVVINEVRLRGVHMSACVNSTTPRAWVSRAMRKARLIQAV